jgi:hypothetical protein
LTDGGLYSLNHQSEINRSSLGQKGEIGSIPNHNLFISQWFATARKKVSQ